MDALLVAQEYVYWYLKSPSCNLINAGGALRKKGYIMGRFSKYIGPGYSGVDAAYNPQANVYVSGFKGAKNVIVAINQSTSSISQQFTIRNGSITGSSEKYEHNVKSFGPVKSCEPILIGFFSYRILEKYGYCNF